MYNPCTSSGSLAVGADRVVSNMSSQLMSIALVPAAAASTVTVYDHSSASSGATVVWSLSAVANGESVSITFNHPIVMNKGIVVVVTGTAAVAFVGFTQGA